MTPPTASSAERPLVSVVVPTYNRADLLRATIDSVLAQTWRPLELIVVDDGSTDGTPELLASYGDRLRAIRQANAGGTAARNAGTRAARGAFLTWLDHDDLMLPAKIERQMAVFGERPELGLVHCGYHRIDKDGRLLDVVTGLPDGDVRARLVCGCFVWSGAPLVRRECLDQVGLFDETVWSSDADMWLRIALAGWEWGCVQQPLGEYRILADSTMADVARTERLDMAILDRIFADPRLPAEARAMRSAAYFNQRFWLATRYYTIGRWADAARNLADALRWRPSFLRDTDDVVAQVAGAAMDPRVADPVRFVHAFLDHLPAAAAMIARERARITATVHLRLAFREYAHGRLDAARTALANALALDAGLVRRPAAFAAALYESARRLPVNLERLASTVFAHLPAEAADLLAHRADVIGRVLLSAGRRAWGLGDRGAAARQMARAMRHDPRISTKLVRKVLRRGGSAVKRSAYAALGESSATRLEAWLRGIGELPPVGR